MNAETIKGYLEDMFRRRSFAYRWEHGMAVITAGLSGRRWKMALFCGEDRLTCYAAYPWEAPRECYKNLLECINSINAVSGFGSFFILKSNAGYLIACRCDVLLADEYSVPEYLEKGVKYAAAALYAQWDAVYTAIFGRR